MLRKPLVLRVTEPHKLGGGEAGDGGGGMCGRLGASYFYREYKIPSTIKLVFDSGLTDQ
jgi:hypothetical protein